MYCDALRGCARARERATRRRSDWRATGIACGIAVTTAIAAAAWLLSVPAYPTSYVSSPIKYTTVAIAAGRIFYTANCALCHGLHGHGDGLSATPLPIKSAEFLEHAAEYRPGDLYWWIAHGIPNTSMPAFFPQLDDAQIWTLIQYLRAMSEVEHGAKPDESGGAYFADHGARLYV